LGLYGKKPGDFSQKKGKGPPVNKNFLRRVFRKKNFLGDKNTLSLDRGGGTHQTTGFCLFREKRKGAFKNSQKTKIPGALGKNPR